MAQLAIKLNQSRTEQQARRRHMLVHPDEKLFIG
jgi:hypothetical protein